MKEGTVFIMVSFPHPWPLVEEKNLLSQRHDSTLIEIFSIKNGSIRIKISNNDLIIKEFVSQPLRFNNIGQTLLTFVWNSEKFELFANSILIKDSEFCEPILIEVKQNLPKGEISIYDKEANKKCNDWINWRSHRYLKLKDKCKAGRRIKTIEEQIQELDNAAQSLETLLTGVNGGKTFLFPSILPILRSLLFWPDGNTNKYNPLLFRIAGYYKIALPLYAFPIMENIPEIVKDAFEHFIFNEPVLQKRLPNQVLMDFQEWLNSTIYIERIDDPFTNSVYKIERRLTYKDLIFEAANTIGTAHYDDDIPIKIDNLLNIEIFGRNFLVDLTLKISDVTLFFSNHILQIINGKLRQNDSD